MNNCSSFLESISYCFLKFFVMFYAWLKFISKNSFNTRCKLLVIQSLMTVLRIKQQIEPQQFGVLDDIISLIICHKVIIANLIFLLCHKAFQRSIHIQVLNLFLLFRVCFFRIIDYNILWFASGFKQQLRVSQQLGKF